MRILSVVVLLLVNTAGCSGDVPPYAVKAFVMLLLAHALRVVSASVWQHG
jgi:hypothetical protein